jgi:hypothetical protein
MLLRIVRTQPPTAVMTMVAPGRIAWSRTLPMKLGYQSGTRLLS